MTDQKSLPFEYAICDRDKILIPKQRIVKGNFANFFVEIWSEPGLRNATCKSRSKWKLEDDF